MKVNYLQLKQIIDKQYAKSELTPAEGGAQSFLHGDLWNTGSIASNRDNYKYLGNMIKDMIFGDRYNKEEIDDENYLYRHLTRLQERFASIHNSL